MNQILYKGKVYGGVGEDVTGKTYGNTTISSVTSFTGGTNSEIFNNYNGENKINIAEGNSSTIIGFNKLIIATSPQFFITFKK